MNHLPMLLFSGPLEIHTDTAVSLSVKQAELLICLPMEAAGSGRAAAGSGFSRIRTFLVRLANYLLLIFFNFKIPSYFLENLRVLKVKNMRNIKVKFFIVEASFFQGCGSGPRSGRILKFFT